MSNTEKLYFTYIFPIPGYPGDGKYFMISCEPHKDPSIVYMTPQDVVNFLSKYQRVVNLNMADPILKDPLFSRLPYLPLPCYTPMFSNPDSSEIMSQMKIAAQPPMKPVTTNLTNNENLVQNTVLLLCFMNNEEWVFDYNLRCKRLSEVANLIKTWSCYIMGSNELISKYGLDDKALNFSSDNPVQVYSYFAGTTTRYTKNKLDLVQKTVQIISPWAVKELIELLDGFNDEPSKITPARFVEMLDKDANGNVLIYKDLNRDYETPLLDNNFANIKLERDNLSLKDALNKRNKGSDIINMQARKDTIERSAQGKMAIEYAERYLYIPDNHDFDESLRYGYLREAILKAKLEADRYLDHLAAKKIDKQANLNSQPSVQPASAPIKIEAPKVDVPKRLTAIESVKIRLSEGPMYNSALRSSVVADTGIPMSNSDLNRLLYQNTGLFVKNESGQWELKKV